MQRYENEKVFVKMPKRKLKIYNAFDEMPQRIGNVNYACINDERCPYI